MTAAGDPAVDMATVHQVIDGEPRWVDVPRAALASYMASGWAEAERPAPEPVAEEQPAALAPARPAAPAEVAPPGEADLAFAAEQAELAAAAQGDTDAVTPDPEAGPAAEGDTTTRRTRPSTTSKER